MKRLFIYTENYQRGGGNQYLVDLINNVPSDYLITIGSNVGGIFEEDFKKITRNYTYVAVPILSIPILNSKLKLLTNNKFLSLCLKVITFLTRHIILTYNKQVNIKILSKIISDANPDLIISCNGGFPGGLSCLDCLKAGKSKNIRSWLSVVSMPLKKSFIDRLYGGIFNDIEKLIVNSETISNDFVRTRHVPHSKACVIHNCLTEDQILKEPILQRPYSRELEEYKIGYVGRIEKAKGIFFLIDAFASLLDTFPNLRLILVGTGPELDLAKNYVISKDINPKITFTGYYAGKISEVIKTFDLFVFPSLWEGLPYSILEAMANSKLVITTNVGGIPEIIKDGYNGFMVPPADADRLKKKIKTVLINADANDEIVSQSLFTIQTRFSEDFFRNNIRRLFSDTASELN